MKFKNKKIAVIGLGYVGLPLIRLFANKGLKLVGYDLCSTKIEQLKRGEDANKSFSRQDLKTVTETVLLTDNEEDLNSCSVFIVTVPTPIDKKNTPDLNPLKNASKTIAKHLKKGDIIIYESTVFPGCTNDICVPILSQKSGLKYNLDFYVGYSPERVNVGDSKYTLENIVKVTSGSTPEVAQWVDNLYNSIIDAGTFKASSIEVAEASKVIENTQRDLNIALMNELAIIFDKLKIDTHEVLKAAQTKWNFLKFSPGLVGGHCIGVDPYYLTHKAKEVGYIPEVILAGRRINDNMGAYVGSKVVKKMLQKDLVLKESKVLVLGITFKENITDIRNTKVIDLVNELKDYNLEVDVYDPVAYAEEVEKQYGIQLLEEIEFLNYDAIVLSVAHKEFISLNWRKISQHTSVIYDVKNIIPKDFVSDRL